MGRIKESAAMAVDQVKATASDARSGVQKAGHQARAEVIKLADRISGRARRRNRARVAVIAIVAVAAAAAIVALRFREDRRRSGL